VREGGGVGAAKAHRGRCLFPEMCCFYENQRLAPGIPQEHTTFSLHGGHCIPGQQVGVPGAVLAGQA